MTEENVHPEDLLDEKQVESQVFPPEDEILPTDDIEVSSEGEPSGKEEMPLDDIDALQAALEENEAKAAEYLDGWQRARAEFANYKKRVERDREQLRQNLKGDLVRQYLPVIDDLERALKDRPQDGDGVAWADGIELTYRKLLSILETEGVATMKAEGELFDPNRHEAIAQTPSDDHESGQIIEVLQQGYLIGERVLRPAVVRVAA
jgi:molecular chaperone GrpE